MSAEMERIVGDAVRALVAQRLCTPPAPAVEHMPAKLQGSEDVSAFLDWLRRFCADQTLREAFLSGRLRLDIQLGGAHRPAPGSTEVVAGAIAAPSAEAGRRTLALNESVVTEAVLRRHAQRDCVITLPARAVVTPSARDYARAAGIHMERKS